MRRPGETLALALGDGVVRLHAVIRRRLARSGLSLAALRTLACLEREGPQRVTELAALEQVTQPSMSALVHRLESQGLVERASDEADARSVIVSITGAGRALLGEVVELRTALLAERLAALSEPEQEAIRKAAPVLARLVEALEDRPVAGRS